MDKQVAILTAHTTPEQCKELARKYASQARAVVQCASLRCDIEGAIARLGVTELLQVLAFAQSSPTDPETP